MRRIKQSRAVAEFACLWLSLSGAFAHPCQSCHPKEVAGYALTGMGRSLHAVTANEQQGDFVHARSETRFIIRSGPGGLMQRMVQNGETSDYQIDYVIGSGNHSACYLARVGDHLFYSPICYYPKLGWAMAPGYADLDAPAYVRPIPEECLWCHSGHPRPIENSLNRYQTPAFSDEAISCDRCHGDATQHIRRPVKGSILTIAKAPTAVRDSICDRCHLSGERVTNPGKKESDFRPGMTLEEVFSSYVWAEPSKGIDHFKIMSAEQAATSLCWRASKGKMWCGSCHGLHGEELRGGAKPEDVAAYYRGRCLSCHAAPFDAAHPSRTSDCIGCHMPKGLVEGPYNSIFTDHRVRRVPDKQLGVIPMKDLIPWREPPAQFRERNLAIAYNKMAQRQSSAELMARSYELLIGVEKSFPDDPDVLKAIGVAQAARGDAVPAAHTFDRVLELRPDDPASLDNDAQAWLLAGDKEKAVTLFERALSLDSLLIPDIEALLKLYRENGDTAKVNALMDRVHNAMKTTPQRPPPRH